MKEFFHPNVITLKHAFYTQGDKVCIEGLSCYSQMKYI